MNNDLMFSSAKCEWETPQDLFDKLNQEYNFSLDVCALPENAKCDQFYTPEDDGLSKSWDGVCWMNPPYGGAIRHWAEKAYISSLMGATVVCLLPARTDARWFHEYCKYGKITFIKGRLKFGGYKHNAPFPSMIVVFIKNSQRGM